MISGCTYKQNSSCTHLFPFQRRMLFLHASSRSFLLRSGHPSLYQYSQSYVKAETWKSLAWKICIPFHVVKMKWVRTSHISGRRVKLWHQFWNHKRENRETISFYSKRKPVRFLSLWYTPLFMCLNYNQVLYYCGSRVTFQNLFWVPQRGKNLPQKGNAFIKQGNIGSESSH